MTTPSPLISLHNTRNATMLEYGPSGSGIQVVESFGNVEFEYASLRKGCVLFDHAQRGTLQIRGEDRAPFLNNMLTQPIVGLKPLHHTSCFWLNRKGRIVADLRLCELGDRIVADVDALVAQNAADSLAEFVITEDVQIQVLTHKVHRLALHGPTAAELLTLASESSNPIGLTEGAAQQSDIAGHQVLVERTDWLGVPGYELSMDPTDVSSVWTHLCQIGYPPELNTETGTPDSPPSSTQASIRMRPTGWLAINMARIEAGSAMFNLDFSSTNLPAETALLDSRIDFNKGCYLGQEVVARMHALGSPTKVLSALILEGERVTASHPEPRQPVTGDQIFSPDDPTGNLIGAITSSTLSPMLGGTPICFAMLKASFAKPSTSVLVTADGHRVKATVHPTLRFWPAQTSTHHA